MSNVFDYYLNSIENLINNKINYRSRHILAILKYFIENSNDLEEATTYSNLANHICNLNSQIAKLQNEINRIKPTGKHNIGL